MKKSIIKLENKVIKNIKPVKGGKNGKGTRTVASSLPLIVQIPLL